MCGKNMKIAPLAESCPPEFYGGTERIGSYLIENWYVKGMRSRCSRAEIHQFLQMKAPSGCRYLRSLWKLAQPSQADVFCRPLELKCRATVTTSQRSCRHAPLDTEADPQQARPH